MVSALFMVLNLSRRSPPFGLRSARWHPSRAGPALGHHNNTFRTHSSRICEPRVNKSTSQSGPHWRASSMFKPHRLSSIQRAKTTWRKAGHVVATHVQLPDRRVSGLAEFRDSSLFATGDDPSIHSASSRRRPGTERSDPLAWPVGRLDSASAERPGPATVSLGNPPSALMSAILSACCLATAP